MPRKEYLITAAWHRTFFFMLLKIENAQIALVVDRVKENSQQLESAIADLGDALQALTDVTRILNARGTLLSIVTKILTLL